MIHNGDNLLRLEKFQQTKKKSNNRHLDDYGHRKLPQKQPVYEKGSLLQEEIAAELKQCSVFD